MREAHRGPLRTVRLPVSDLLDKAALWRPCEGLRRPGVGAEGGMSGQTAAGFQGGGTVVHDRGEHRLPHAGLSPRNGSAPPKVSPTVNCGLGATVMCQGGRTDCNTRPFLAWDTGRGGGWVGMWAQGLPRICPYLLLSFAINRKLL